jgi:hypothetical protein
MGELEEFHLLTHLAGAGLNPRFAVILKLFAVRLFAEKGALERRNAATQEVRIMILGRGTAYVPFGVRVVKERWGFVSGQSQVLRLSRHLHSSYDEIAVRLSECDAGMATCDGSGSTRRCAGSGLSQHLQPSIGHSTKKDLL